MAPLSLHSPGASIGWGSVNTYGQQLPHSREPRIQSGMETADKEIQGVEQALHKLAAAAPGRSGSAEDADSSLRNPSSTSSSCLPVRNSQEQHRDTMHLISIKPRLGLPSLLRCLVFFRGTQSRRANAHSLHFFLMEV